MSCIGLCAKDKKSNQQNDVRIVSNKAVESVMETQTSEPEVPTEPRDTIIVLDCGSSKLRAGFAGDDTPLITIPTVVGKSMAGDVTKKVFGTAALTSSNDYKLTYPVDGCFIKDWHDIEDLYEYVFEHQLHIQPKMHQLLLTEALNNPSINQEKTAEMVFEKFEFNSFLLVPSTSMAMYGCNSTTGVIVESGAAQTHVVAFQNAEYIPNSYRHLQLGGNDLTKYMGVLLSESGKETHFSGKRNEHEILNEIKRIGCHVVLNYDNEMVKLKMNPNLVPCNAILRDGTMIGLKMEAFQVPELLFKPEIIGLETGGIPLNIYECIESCDPSLKKQLYENICLSGGNTMFDGIVDRLLWEVKLYAGPKVKVKINALPARDNLVFLGASLISVMPKLRDYLISYQEYHEAGPQILQWKRF